MKFEEEMEETPLTEEEEKVFFSGQVPLYEKAIFEFRSATEIKKRYFSIAQAAKATYMLGLFSEAKQWAEEMPELLELVPKDWNYGNVVYYQNWVLGMLALDCGDLESAKQYLTLAGSSIGSPQLNSFGPNMKLAKRLLKSGEKEAFLNFLNQIEVFWSSGKLWLRVWRKKVDEGEIPNCTMHLS
jgi:hypothetical protein